jgi:hypothetical protein
MKSIFPSSALRFTAVFVILLSIITLNSCEKVDVKISKPTNELNIDVYKSWLNKNGGIYKNEAVNFKLTNGTIVQAKLRWTAARLQSRRQTQFVEIPFFFNSNASANGILLNDGGVDMHPTSYSLILKLVNGKPVEVKMKSLIYDYKDNTNNPKTLGLNEYRLLFDSEGNFQTGLYYNGNRKKSTIASSDKNEST